MAYLFISYMVYNFQLAIKKSQKQHQLYNKHRHHTVIHSCKISLQKIYQQNTTYTPIKHKYHRRIPPQTHLSHPGPTEEKYIPFPPIYLNKVDANKHTSPHCPLCKLEIHTLQQFFNCTQLHTTLSTLSTIMAVSNHTIMAVN